MTGSDGVVRSQERAPAQSAGPQGPLLVAVSRDGVVESTHRVIVAIVDADGRRLAAAGDVDAPVYARSALKPAQAVACLDLLDEADRSSGRAPPDGGSHPGWGPPSSLDVAAVAIGTGSHVGSDDQQVEAARLLALAGQDESVLRCPPARPVAGGDEARLAFNCSGKHALFVLASVAAGADPARHLDPGAPVQRRVADRLATLVDEVPQGPGVDGCGAPAWRVSTHGLALLGARLASADATADPSLAAVAAAMRQRPDLVGGPDAVDTALMLASARVVAKRGAEGVLVAGAAGSEDRRAIGVAVKVIDGAARATGPVVAETLAGCGVEVPESVRCPPVLGGGEPHGEVAVTAAFAVLVGGLRDA